MTDKVRFPVSNGEDEANHNDPVTEASIESFPASDAPGWIPTRIGSAAPTKAPRQRDGKTRKRE